MNACNAKDDAFVKGLRAMKVLDDNGISIEFNEYGGIGFLAKGVLLGAISGGTFSLNECIGVDIYPEVEFQQQVLSVIVKKMGIV